MVIHLKPIKSLDDTTSTNYIFVYGNGDSERLDENKVYDWLENGAPYRIMESVHVWENDNPQEVAILRLHPGAKVYFNPGDYNADLKL